MVAPAQLDTTCTECHGTGACSTGNLICRCMQVTEQQVLDAIAAGHARSVQDLRCETGAGTGCMGCHWRLKRMMQTATT
jgi:bacterioferritin-associated ferredoxin